jgi:serine/threonine protein kinase
MQGFGHYAIAQPAAKSTYAAFQSIQKTDSSSCNTDQRLLPFSNTRTMCTDGFSTLGALPSTNAGTHDGTPLDDLERVLDNMHESDELFFGKFAVLNFLARRAGGQGCVQFVRRIPDQVQFAVKFFLQNELVFEREHSLYSNASLRPILPEALHIVPNKDSQVRSQSGYVFPPFIMVEKGESLNEWASRKSPDFATSLFVLLHIAERLQRLHQSGLCHRDVKPANILWRPLSNSWTLIDYGCAATMGASGCLSQLLAHGYA